MKNFCVLPFNSVSINALGSLRPCCNSTSDLDYHINNGDTHGIINNAAIQEVRNSFLKDEQDEKCSRCWNIEKISNSSFRHVANNDANHGLKSVIPIRYEKEVQYEDIQYLDITLGNKCNLACRMCNQYSSSLLAIQLKDMGMISGDTFIDFDRKSKDKILDLINKSTNLNSLYLLGGEPLINEFHDEIVDLLVQKDRAKNITVHYSTNLQIDIEKYLGNWERFKFVDLSISIDGTGSTYEYIRWPGKWKKVKANLSRVYEFRKALKFNPSIATTIQNLNANNIYDLITECYDLANGPTPFFFIPVTGGYYLEMTPAHILESEISKLETLQDPNNRVEELIKHYKESIIKSKNLNHSTVEYFFNSQQRFDEYRKQNLFATLPYFLELANKFKITQW